MACGFHIIFKFIIIIIFINFSIDVCDTYFLYTGRGYVVKQYPRMMMYTIFDWYFHAGSDWPGGEGGSSPPRPLA